jgi:hypothetical protein
MYFIIYKITNRLNGKFYIGMHQTSNPDDGYYGSGTNIKRAIAKYGKENFAKEILHSFASYEEMVEAEKKIVTADLVESEDCYNINCGGHGGWYHARKQLPETPSEITKKRISEALMGVPKTVETRNRMSKSRPAGWYNHTEEALLKISTASKNRNSGTVWINNSTISKRYPAEQDIPNGWVKGRLKQS